jgi:hypothetical protein
VRVGNSNADNPPRVDERGVLLFWTSRLAFGLITASSLRAVAQAVGVIGDLGL